jgi:hypothetical protein
VIHPKLASFDALWFGEKQMNPASPKSARQRLILRKSITLGIASLLFAALVLFVATVPRAVSLSAADAPQTFPLDQVKPGMTGVAYTIFEGDQIDKIDLTVIGVLPNLLGPKQSVILVELHGAQADHTGVVAGMSGSPVYIDGKLAGALSLKMGVFAKDAIAGVTPIEDMLTLPAGKATTGAASASAKPADAASPSATPEPTIILSPSPVSGPASFNTTNMPRYTIPPQISQTLASTAGSLPQGAYLEPIAAPLAFTGFNPSTLRQYSGDWLPYGMESTAAGAGAPEPDDAKIVPGDMVSFVLVEGDLSIDAACTVTAIVEDRVYACGHPLFGSGNTKLPLARGRVVTTLASGYESTKLVKTGGVIGTLTEDRSTAVMGRMGAAPSLIPVDLSVVTPDGEKQFHMQMIANPKLTPLLMGLVAFNGLTQNTAYTDGTTMRLSGTIDIDGHPSVSLENMYAPTDLFIPDGSFVASSVQAVFARIFSNPYETPGISRVSLKVESLPERRIATIENAWSDSSDADPGQNVTIKVMLHPYRGSPVIEEVPITIPPQAAHGSTLRVQVSDSDSLNRLPNLLAAQGRLGSLDQLITLLNRERRNDRVYVSVFKPTPTLLVEDKELPDAPISAISIMDQGRVSPNSALLRESEVGEWSVSTDQVIAGSDSVLIKVK